MKTEKEIHMEMNTQCGPMQVQEGAPETPLKNWEPGSKNKNLHRRDMGNMILPVDLEKLASKTMTRPILL
jgi:hypothetical protein